MKRRPNHLLHPPVQRRAFLHGMGASALGAGLLGATTACGSSDDEETNGGDDSFSFVVISDTHVRLPGNPDDVTYDNQANLDHLAGVVERINNELADATCVVITGDLVGCLYSDDAADYLVGNDNPAERFKSIVDNLALPYYPVLGNHDYQKGYDEANEEGIMTEDITRIEAVWKKVLGIDPYYTDVVSGVRFVFLNSNRGPARFDVCEGNDNEAFCTGSFDDDQLTWLENQLAQPERAILFLHHPPFTDNPARLWSMLPSFLVQQSDRFYEIVQAHSDKIAAIFCGHGHLWCKDTLFEKIEVFETSSTGDHNGDDMSYHLVRVSPSRGLIEVIKGDPDGRYM